jgi:3D (Asp-Asp-Asp) domain-containing protein
MGVTQGKWIGVLAVVILSAGTPAPASPAPGDVIGKFRNTWYYLPRESDFAPGPAVPLIDLSGSLLVHVVSSFKKDLDMQGSGEVLDGRIVNYAGRINGQIRFAFTTAPYGLGVGHCELIPLHTIAVDHRRIPYGSVVRIEETVGMIFPDGPSAGIPHDGLWRAEDTGSAIQADRIDLFMGPGRINGNFLEKSGITTLMPLTVTLVQPPEPGNCTQ